MTNKQKASTIPKVTTLDAEKRYSSVSDIPAEEREAMKQRCLKAKSAKNPKV